MKKSTILELVFGPLADRFGKRQVITVAMIAFTIGTGLSALGRLSGDV